MTFSLLSQYIESSGTAGLLWLYLVLHLFVGSVLPYRRGTKPYLFMAIEHAGFGIERKLNRENRSQSARFIRGLVAAILFGSIACLIGYSVRHAASMPEGWVIELAFLSLCVNFIAPLKLIRHVILCIRGNKLHMAAEALQPYSQAPLDKTDMHALIRKSMEFIAFSLVRFFVGPAFWFLIAGLVGLSIYTTYAALHQSSAPADERRKSFGKCVRIINVLLNIFPALVTAFILAVSAVFVSKSNPVNSIRTTFQQMLRHKSSCLLWPVAAIAGGLGVTLGGSVRYSPDYVEQQAWIESYNSSARPAVDDLSRAAMMQYVSFVCAIGIDSIFIILGI